MSVRLERDGHVAVLTLDRPEKLNAIDGPMYAEINARLREIDTDDDIRAAVVTGAGDRAFSAGADLFEHGEETGDMSWPSLDAGNYDHGLVVNTPLVAAVDGYCLAAGLELALFCDIRIAGRDARFGAPEVRWGLLHNYGCHRLPQVVGLGNAMQLLLTGARIDAEHALRIGLVQEVVEAGTALRRALDVAELIAGNAPLAVRATKELAQLSSQAHVGGAVRHAAALARLLDASADAVEGTTAFAEKRPARFEGR